MNGIRPFGKENIYFYKENCFHLLFRTDERSTTFLELFCESIKQFPALAFTFPCITKEEKTIPITLDYLSVGARVLQLIFHVIGVWRHVVV